MLQERWFWTSGEMVRAKEDSEVVGEMVLDFREISKLDMGAAGAVVYLPQREVFLLLIS